MNSGQELIVDLPAENSAAAIRHMIGFDDSYNNWFVTPDGMIIKVENINTVEKYG